VIRLSQAERWALAGAAAILALHALTPVQAHLEYRHALLAREPWRLLTGHWVHINWMHAGINAAAWIVVARLFAPDLGARQQALALLVASLAIGVGLALLHPTIVWYRGFSGALHGLFFAGTTCWLVRALAQPARRSLRDLWLPVALCAGGWIKVIAEQPGGSATPFADWLGAGTVPQAHLLGAVAGALVGAALALRPRRRAGAAEPPR
jgi:rhomboid family GlyGly-CTERM serine protease